MRSRSMRTRAEPPSDAPRDAAKTRLPARLALRLEAPVRTGPAHKGLPVPAQNPMVGPYCAPIALDALDDQAMRRCGVLQLVE